MSAETGDFDIWGKQNIFPGVSIVVLPADTQERLRGRDPHLPKFTFYEGKC